MYTDRPQYHFCRRSAPYFREQQLHMSIFTRVRDATEWRVVRRTISPGPGPSPETKRRRIKQVRISLAKVLISFLVLAMALPVSGETITIDNTSGTPTIAKALLYAGDNGTVVLRPGIYFENSIVLENSATITADKSAGYGAEDTIIDAEQSGRIFDAAGYSLSIDNLTFRNGKADHGGAIYLDSGTLSVTSSVFANCSADYGGAIFSDTDSTVTVISSAFTNCSAINSGGAILSGFNSTVTVVSSAFTNCSAVNTGGAIYIFSGTLNTTSTAFFSCSASSYSGGAIYSSSFSPVTITSSSFTGCSSPCRGGAICSYKGGSMHFCRIYNCSLEAPAVYSHNNFDASENWWGTNTDPSGFSEGSVRYDPWLVLGVATSSVTVATGETSVIRANLTHDVNGIDTSGNGLLPDGIPVTFDLAAGLGNLSVTGGEIAGGANGTIFTAAGSGLVTVTAKADGQTVGTFTMVTS
ncbi:polymorphic outer membrane protein [Methanolacinia petrolearia DSM 11571]|uniref:Polymorphic outer membrane protein n=2 Tax=Methanolacinia TaxID=230355 RepID=E1RG44_METP4|nr:polymorphic outer membrane protein [Methanolacinia petrolearia DSM 11571]